MTNTPGWVPAALNVLSKAPGTGRYYSGQQQIRY